MGYASFLSALLETGRVRVPAPAELAEEELRAGDTVLAEFERHYRLELPGEPPPLDARAARWAGTLFFRACQLAVYRDVSAEATAEALSVPCPSPPSPATHYAADVVFRFLPDLVRFAHSAAENDPLLDHLRRWAGEWPLSSVGMVGVEGADATVLAGHPALLALYVDRILATRDRTRLGNERVREGVRRALGLHADLAPDLAAALNPEPQPESHP